MKTYVYVASSKLSVPSALRKRWMYLSPVSYSIVQACLGLLLPVRTDASVCGRAGWCAFVLKKYPLVSIVHPTNTAQFGRFCYTAMSSTEHCR